MNLKPYRVHVRGNRWRSFETFHEASKFVGEVFRQSGIVLSIIKSES